MDAIEHLLVLLSEESAEIGQAAAKALRFGLAEICINQPDGPTNLERLVGELNDLLAVAKVMVQAGILSRNWQNEGMQAAKMERIAMWMQYSSAQGILQPNVPMQPLRTVPRDGTLVDLLLDGGAVKRALWHEGEQGQGSGWVHPLTHNAKGDVSHYLQLRGSPVAWRPLPGVSFPCTNPTL